MVPIRFLGPVERCGFFADGRRTRTRGKVDAKNMSSKLADQMSPRVQFTSIG